MTMKPYSEYKESGIEWIGKVPIGWQKKKLKYLVSERLKYGANESGDSVDRTLPRYIRITDFDKDGKLRQDTFRSLSIEKAQEYLLKNGDILFARSGATVGKSFQFKDFEGLACFAGYLIKATPNDEIIESDYLYFYTKSNAYENWKNSIFSQATIQNIGADKYQYLEIPVPSLEEQKSIIYYINNKIQRINGLIEKKEKLVDLLKEKHAAIINRAVTKGLNPNVKMKDSGIPWLGKIPEHWDAVPLKYIAYMKGRIGWQGLKQSEFIDKGPFLITGMNFKKGKIDWDECYHITEERYSEAPEIHVKEGDVLMTKDGTIGKLLYVDNLPGKASLNSHLLLIRPIDMIFNSKFRPPDFGDFSLIPIYKKSSYQYPEILPPYH